MELLTLGGNGRGIILLPDVGQHLIPYGGGHDHCEKMTARVRAASRRVCDVIDTEIHWRDDVIKKKDCRRTRTWFHRI